MSRRLLLGIDVGTTSAKAVVADADGMLLAQAGQEYATHYPQPGWAEQDPDDWWRAVCTILRQIVATAGVDPAGIAAICISSQAPTLVAVDGAGHPLHPAILWMDRRAEPQCQWLREHVGEETVAAINGGPIDPYFLAPKLLWLCQHHADRLAGGARILLTNGYVALRLTGVASMDQATGPLTQMFDTAAGQWSDTLLDAMRIDRSLLLPATPSAEIIGTVTPEAAAATGLRAGTPVLAGMLDGAAAGLEAGLVRPGDAVEMTGQSTVLMICSDQPYRGRELFPAGHVAAGRWLVVGATVASGGALRWFRDQLGEPERAEAERLGLDPFAVLTREAAASPPGANRLLFLPYLYGERSPIWDSNARGVFCGLTLASTRADMVRAILEGAAFSLRHNAETAAAAGFPMRALACVGGGTRSPLWNQIKADILQQGIALPRAPTGAPMGDCILAAASAGLYPSLEAAVATMVQAGDRYAPDPALGPRYDALYAVYRSLYPALRGPFASLAAV